VLEGVVDAFGVDSLTISGYALREGVLLDTLQRREGGTLHHLSDLGRRSVQRLVAQCDEEPAHSAAAKTDCSAACAATAACAASLSEASASDCARSASCSAAAPATCPSDSMRAAVLKPCAAAF
jgi:exopolyphosphatase/pppGpp-phosphohydrolase